MAAGGVSLALAPLSSVAFAAGAQAVWEGFATSTAQTSECMGDPSAALTAHVSIFRPKVTNSDPPTDLAFVFLRGAFTMENKSESTVLQMNGSGDYAGVTINAAAVYDYKGSYNLSVTPAHVTALTPVVNITGTIDNFGDITDCQVTFKGTYVNLGY
jgi:hypothetical protein